MHCHAGNPVLILGGILAFRDLNPTLPNANWATFALTERWVAITQATGDHYEIPFLHLDERGLSRRQLAEAVGVNHQTIGYLERGDYTPSLELALKIARHFGVAVEMIFSLDRFAMTFGRAGENE